MKIKTTLTAKAIVVISLILNLFFCSLYAQRCDTYNYKKYSQTNSFFDLSKATQNKSTKDTSANETITIPVVIHVLYNTTAQNISEAQILSQLTSLNNDYRKLNADAANVPTAFLPFAGDAKINFCLAKIDASGKATPGIIRKYTSVQNWTADDGMKFSAQGGDNAWDSKRYLNIWVCNLSGKSLGYSSLPGSQADKDGVVIQFTAFGTTGNVVAPFDKGRTATHEIGHWLGLQHLWGDANCGSDGIDDTPTQQTYNDGCPSFPHKSACSINANGDMFMNFMDFTNDACMIMFTKGQVIKIRSQFAAGGYRNSFLNSSVCSGDAVQGGPLPADTIETIMFINVYPNPAINLITIESNKATEVIGKTLKIYNVYGAQIFSQILTSIKNPINIEKFSKGIYFIKVSEGKEKHVMRFIKE